MSENEKLQIEAVIKHVDEMRMQLGWLRYHEAPERIINPYNQQMATEVKEKVDNELDNIRTAINRYFD